MIKRLGIGLLKGAFIGGALGGFFHFGLGWTTVPVLLGYLLAMGTGATAGLLAGNPPWRQHAWLESLLKALAGLGLGALLHWGMRRWLAAPLPAAFELGDSHWVDLPLLALPPIAIFFAALIELDHSDDDPKTLQSSRNQKKVRMTRSPDIVDAEVLPGGNQPD